MQGLTRLQNCQYKVRYSGLWQRKWPFLTIVLNILKANKIWWDNLLTFSGHLDTEGPIPVRKFDLWLSWSQQGGGSLFDHGQLSMTSIWLNQNMGPPPSWLKLCQISNFLAGVHFSTSKWPEKIWIWFASLYQDSESSNWVRYDEGVKWKGPFLKMVLIILKSNEVWCICFWFFWSFGYWTTLKYPIKAHACLLILKFLNHPDCTYSTLMAY